jgi:antitoxin component YwqK of YwqJK toxin-antitoxin module
LETECEYYYSQNEFDEYMGSFLVGDYINYYSNGQIKDICYYEDDKKNGEYIRYHENGKIKAKGNYENNYLVGYEYRYDIDGNLIEKVFVDENEDDYNENE